MTHVAPSDEMQQASVLAAMSEDEKQAALRFCDTCDDNEGYDVPRDMMKRLEALGLVKDKRFGRFEQTTLLLDIRDALQAEGECPRCYQNSWLANHDDGELTVCENCGFDTSVDD